VIRNRPAAKAPIRVLLVDDQKIIRRGIRALLSEVESIQVVGEAGGGQEAVAMVQSLDPDVTVMDLAMPGMDGIEAIRRIIANDARARVLVLTSFSGDDKVFPAVKAGALGYLLKGSQPADLILAIQQVSRGQSWLHPTIAGRLLRELRHPTRKTPPPPDLPAREAKRTHLAAKVLSKKTAAQLAAKEH
jgi:NarL family two-component system response regulator LiaR